MKSAGTGRSAFRPGALILASALATGAATANDITGKQSFICTAWQAISCSTASECESTEAWRLNLPDFVRVDLDAETMGTLAGSDEDRETVIESVVRRDERIFLNGTQEDRGFTWVIHEASGEGTLAIVSDTTAITLFTVCAATDDMR